MSILTVRIDAASIQCVSQTGFWCKISESVAGLAVGEHLSILNADHRNNVQIFQWLRRSKLKRLPTVIFETFPNLWHLDLAIGIDSLHVTDFENAGNLVQLKLTRNYIRRLHSYVFIKASNLTYIDLDSNQISEVQDSTFRGLNYLLQVNFNNNFLHVLSRDAFVGAVNLETLSFERNQISTIEEGVFDLPKLREINLSFNQIYSLPDGLFLNAPQLLHLNLSDNLLLQLPQALIKSPTIVSLVLDANDMPKLDLSDFIRIKKLEILSLKYVGVQFSQARNTPHYASKSLLRSLDLTYNNLGNTDILNQLSMFGNLKEIWLAFNGFTTVDDVDTVKELFPELTKISLEVNDIDCKWLKKVSSTAARANVRLITDCV